MQVLILVPSRELALQIDTVFRSMGTSWKTCCCYGGHPIAEEKKSIAGNHPAIIIGTPGRITDHLSKGNFDPETIETLIIDEFDKSLEFGFHDEMAEIITQLPGLKKRMLLSATDAEEIPQFTGLNRTVKLDFLPEATEEQENRLKLMKVLSPSKDKIATLYNLLCVHWEAAPALSSVIIGMRWIVCTSYSKIRNYQPNVFMAVWNSRIGNGHCISSVTEAVMY